MGEPAFGVNIDVGRQYRNTVVRSDRSAGIGQCRQARSRLEELANGGLGVTKSYGEKPYVTLVFSIEPIEVGQFRPAGQSGATPEDQDERPPDE